MKVNSPVKFDSIQLGKDLRAWQARKGKTLNEIAKITGINTPTLSRIRNGKENALFLEVALLAFTMGYEVPRYIVPKTGGENE